MSRTTRTDGSRRRHMHRGRVLNIMPSGVGIPLPGELSLTYGGKGSRAKGVHGYVPDPPSRRPHTRRKAVS